MWVLHLKLILHLNLQYLDLYLLLPTRILGFRCNTYIRISLYQLEFWGSLQYLNPYLLLPIGILGPNCNTCTYFYELGFCGLLTIHAFNTNIFTVILFLHFTLFVFITWKQSWPLCHIKIHVCVEYMMFKEFGLWFSPTKLIVKQNS